MYGLTARRNAIFHDDGAVRISPKNLEHLDVSAPTLSHFIFALPTKVALAEVFKPS
jgi:hypothetical protein